MTHFIRRREFVGGLGAAALWPMVAGGQQRSIPAVGFLKSTGSGTVTVSASAFRDGLRETGFVEGRNVTIEYRWADGQLAQLSELASELVRRGVAVIATPGDTPAARAAKAATSTIPVVFSIANDPVELGLVASLN